MKFLCVPVLSILCAALGACTGLTQMQDTASKFNQSVHVATAAEMNLFREVQAAECSRNFFAQGFTFATAQPIDAKHHRYAPGDSVLDLDPAHCRPLHDDQVGDRAEHSEVAGKGRGHCYGQPRGVLIA